MHLLTSKDVIEQICLLMKRDYSALGFLPRGAVEGRWNLGDTILQRDGKEIYGYFIHGTIRPGQMMVGIQHYVDMDARRMKAGQRMWMELIAKGSKGMATRIRIKCAEGLESNLFWQAVGCRLVSTIHPKHRGWRHVAGILDSGSKRRRAINVYEFNLQDTFLAPSDMGKLWLPDGVERHER